LRSALLSGAGAASAVLALPVAASAQDYVQPGFFYEVPASVEAGETDPSVLPTRIRQAAIDTRSGSEGRIAGARIGDSDFYVVFLETTYGCGSGGCRAQIWEYNERGLKQHPSLPAGHLPITMLPQEKNGKPSLGLTVSNEDVALVILPITFGGTSYTEWDWTKLLPADSGQTLINARSLEPFTNKNK